MKCGDNINSVHKMKVLDGLEEAVVAFCERCKQKYVIRRDKQGRPEQPKYSKIFKRDTLQPHMNLYYKEYPNKMNVI